MNNKSKYIIQNTGVIRVEAISQDNVHFQEELRRSVRRVCNQFPTTYWRDLDAEHAYPQEFVNELTRHGFLSALIPEEFAGAGLGISEAAIILEEINRSGGNAGACHAQMYIMGTLARHGSQMQKEKYLPKIANGSLRLQAFGVTEPTTGSDTTKLRTFAERRGDHYIVNGQKVFISRTEHSDLLMLLVRTTPLSQVKKKTEGLSILLVDLKEAVKNGITIRPIQTMMNHATTELFIENLKVPVENLIGEEGKGFSYILDGMNAERILIAAECIGDGRWFIEKSTQYARERIVFDRPIGQNQGIQFPLAKAHIQIEAADLMRKEAARLFDLGEKCGAEANMSKLLAAEASWEAANAALQTFGGYGFAAEYDVERKFRETRLYQVAPISTNMILSYISEHILSLPKSY